MKSWQEQDSADAYASSKSTRRPCSPPTRVPTTPISAQGVDRYIMTPYILEDKLLNRHAVARRSWSGISVIGIASSDVPSHATNRPSRLLAA
jgi:hypothetical protein